MRTLAENVIRDMGHLGVMEIASGLTTNAMTNLKPLQPQLLLQKLLLQQQQQLRQQLLQQLLLPLPPPRLQNLRLKVAPFLQEIILVVIRAV